MKPPPDITSVCSLENSGILHKPSGQLPADFARNLAKAAKHLRLAAHLENRYLTHSENEAVKILDELLEKIK